MPRLCNKLYLSCALPLHGTTLHYTTLGLVPYRVVIETPRYRDKKRRSHARRRLGGDKEEDKEDPLPANQLLELLREPPTHFVRRPQVLSTPGPAPPACVRFAQQKQKKAKK